MITTSLALFISKEHLIFSYQENELKKVATNSQAKPNR